MNNMYGVLIDNTLLIIALLLHFLPSAIALIS